MVRSSSYRKEEKMISFNVTSVISQYSHFPVNVSEPDPKNSTEPKSKLIKYSNRFKILVFREAKLKPKLTRNEVFQVPEYIRNRYISKYNNYF